MKVPPSTFHPGTCALKLFSESVVVTAYYRYRLTNVIFYSQILIYNQVVNYNRVYMTAQNHLHDCGLCR